MFKDDPATSESPIYKARNALIALRDQLSVPGENPKMVWRLVAGPLTYFRDYICLEAACQINNLWEQQVLVEIQGVADKTERNALLFENNGYALKFIKTTAAPFLSRNLKQGFFPKSALGRMIPFKRSFLTFLTEGVQLAKFKPELKIEEEIPLELRLDMDSTIFDKPEEAEEFPKYNPKKLRDNYKVMITADPTGVNQEARIRPHATTLELICADKPTTLVNLNYPIRKEFDWQPEKCKTVNLTIDVGSLSLRKQYEGPLAFPLFLNDFSTGSHLFSKEDFPKNGKDIDLLKIRFIKVNYRFEGARPLIELVEEEEKRKQEEKEAEQARLAKAADQTASMKEMLLSWERKQKEAELQNEALKRAWKTKQEQKAAALKKAWEEKLPEVPYTITTCWDE